MPIYEYRCSLCGHELEALQKFSDAPLVSCPSCSKDALVKLVSAAGFQLKGTGWYVTDFRSASGAKSAPASGEAKPAEGKADAKPEAKPEAKSDAPAATPAATPSPTPAAGGNSSSS